MEPGSCHLWWARAGDAHPRLRALLDPQDRARLAELRRQQDRDRSLVGRSLVRLALAGYLASSPADVRISRACFRCGKPHGKPRLAHPSPGRLELSVSHSGDRVVVAVCAHARVGVDIERLRPHWRLDIERLSAKVLTPAERLALHRLPPEERAGSFLTTWTRKEAVVKATGRGLTVPLSTVEVSAAGGTPAGVALRELDPGAGYVASLAVLGRCTQVVDLDGTALLKQPA